MTTATTIPSLTDLLDGPGIRRAERAGRTVYAAVDVVAELTADEDPTARLAAVRQRVPTLRLRTADFDGDRLPAATLAEAVELALATATPRAARFRPWVAAAAARHVDESTDPDRIAARARRHPGHDRRWVDRRSAAVASRRDLTGEWAARGAVTGDDYRQLTNELARHGFGHDVVEQRATLGLTGRPSANLRDHLSDVDLLLTALGESTAVALMRSRDSRGMDALLRDAADAGRTVAAARAALPAA